MCTYIDTIKASYSEVGRRTSRVARKSFRRPVAKADKSEPCSDLKTWHVDAPRNVHFQDTLELLKTIA